MPELSDWQLPPGVNRGLWDYAHNDALARGYDAGLAGSSLFHLDIEFVRQHAGPPGRLIDLGCGTGRLLSAMAADGWRCLGVDLSPAMLAVARERGGPNVSLIRANLTQIEVVSAGSFDVAACLFSTLGMVVGAEQRRRVVAGARRLLRPGGRFLLHVHNRWFHLWDGDGRRWLLANGFGGERVMPTHQGVTGLTIHLFTRGEIVALLRDTGFRLIEVRPISLAADGRLAMSWLLPNLRAYGYLIAAEAA